VPIFAVAAHCRRHSPIARTWQWHLLLWLFCSH